jgi:hypothetical protein
MSPLRVIPMLLLLVLQPSCAPADADTAAEGGGAEQAVRRGQAEIRRASATLAASIGSSAHQFACGTTAAGQPTEVIAFTGRQCLGCRSIGWLLRTRLRESRRSSGSVWAAIAAADTPVVCPYLQREGAHLPVVVVPPEALADEKLADRIVFLGRGPTGRLARVYAEPEGLMLVHKLEEGR